MESQKKEKNKLFLDMDDPTNKFYLSDIDVVYVRNRNGEFEVEDDYSLLPAEIDIMWGGLPKSQVEEAVKHCKEMFEELNNLINKKQEKKLNEGYFEVQKRLFESHPEMENPAFWDEGAPKSFRIDDDDAILDEYEAMLDDDDDMEN